MTWTPPQIPKRRPGWERAFVEEMNRHLAVRFRWGVSDCLTVAADLCEAMTGVDPFPEGLRGSYSTAEAAARELARQGFEDVSKALGSVFTAIPRARARRGDCGTLTSLLDGRPVVSTFIVLGTGMAIGRQQNGGALVAVQQLEATFAIGHPDWMEA
jgi:hypothetical protein